GQPRILFADEPTGNLDSATGAVVEKLLFDYARANKATLVVVTHDQDLAAKCDIQIHVKDGRITEVKQ
ncbi:MAG TPA: ABC transporter ATP-binding protein, partial [Candidatus Saccharibacteria bacterium]|nr:ABC transporter ATP-binding protein [Candidatus Saccharibacteria bacterium]